MIDSTLVKAHQQATTGKRGRLNRWRKRSRGGLTSKIHMLCDALGRPLRFILTAGQKADCQQVLPLLEGVQTKTVLADRGYDTNSIRNGLAENKIEAVVPSRILRREHIPHEEELYKKRNLAESYFGWLKYWRRIATRFDRNDSHFMGFIYLAASIIWLA